MSLSYRAMSDSSSNTKRITRNTLFLYIRMLILMIISLFTSRVVLNTLGVEDFGTYNVVGGIVAMFGFISGPMSGTTQRYLNFELARGDGKRLQRIFNTSMQIHALIALFIIILGETVGLWFLLNKLVIPDGRMTAAMWVYQCSIVSCAINILSTPYNADIIAHERMSAFAYISILEAGLKLIIVFLLVISPIDKLIVYAILIVLVQLIIRYIYSSYCHRHFAESSLEFAFDKSLFKEMSGFAGWSFVGNLAGILYTQGLNMMLNIFFGPVVNAARGIAVQVQGTIQQFVGGFQTAINPQITKSFASGELKEMHSLMFRSARFSFLLLFAISLPVLLETEFSLHAWLGNVPDGAVIFTQLMICISLIYTTANPCVIANQATGKVKVYQLVVGGILLTILPISYIALKMGAPAYSVFIVHFCVESVAQIARMLMLRKLINLPVRQYLKNIYFPVILTVAVAVICPVIVRHQMDQGWLRFIIVGLSCVISVGLSTLFIGLTRSERRFVLDKGLKLLRIRK